MSRLRTDLVAGLLATTWLFGHYRAETALLLWPGPYPPGPYAADPPPGHPERVVPGLPPSRAERELWAQFPD